jgi:elongation factor P
MNVPIKRGMVIRHQNHLFAVAEFNERHTGKQRPTVHVLLRDLLDGHQVDRTLDDLLPIHEVEHGYRKVQYLYAKGDVRVFIYSETFVEYEVGPAQLQGGEPFLLDGGEYRMVFADDRPILLEIPDKVDLHVILTAPPERSVGTGGTVTKEATLENGLMVRVPLFIKTGDLIRVDTRSRTYAGKEKE